MSDRKTAIFEQQITIIKAVNNCNFSITNQRIIVFNLKTQFTGAIVGGAIGGAVGGVIGATIEKHAQTKNAQKEKALEGLTINEILQADKKAYSISYNDIASMYLNKSMFGNSLNINLNKGSKYFKLNKEQANQLQNIFSNIKELEGKFKIG